MRQRLNRLWRGLLLVALATFGRGAVEAAATDAMEWVRVAEDGRGFVLEKSGRAFIPWGFNYDHDGAGRLIEDYWDSEWTRVEEDFGEMKELGANVVRIHLQFGRFMGGPDEPNPKSLRQLKRLVALAEKLGLYLDITGLGCYHKEDVPAWYDALETDKRWEAQARFWEAIARACKGSPAIFCYDLMNEPVVPTGDTKQDDWLGPAFADKHFVQFIALERAGRDRPEMARAWIEHLTRAIRKLDDRHLITVGLVPWSLKQPGLQSGYEPDKIAGALDFLSVHLYPENGRVDEALETLRGFDVGKPLLIEEMFPLKCSPQELTEFIERSASIADGWLGFYWGTTPRELRDSARIQDVLTLGWLEAFQKRPHEKR